MFFGGGGGEGCLVTGVEVKMRRPGWWLRSFLCSLSPLLTSPAFPLFCFLLNGVEMMETIAYGELEMEGGGGGERNASQ